MHAITILRQCLNPLLTHIHARRLATLFEAVASCIAGPRLTLTDVGRRFGGGASLRHKIKRADRLLGNTRLHSEAGSIYTAVCHAALARVREPVIIVDWSDLKPDQSLQLLRASLAVGGRSLTLYEEVHPQRKLGNRGVQHRFLQRLAQRLPAGAAPIIVADSGFKVPFFREVERLGWRWVGRIRGRDYIRLSKQWVSCTTLFQKATETPTGLGEGDWVRSNPLRALFVLVRRAKQGRSAKTADGRRSRSKKSMQAARAAREPWLLVASTALAAWTPKKVAKLYRRRMQIEESFRDMKSQHFGEGLECSRSDGGGRFTVLVLIASLAAFLLWLLGTAAERLELHQRLRPGSRKRRAYSRLFLARLLLVLDSYRHLLEELFATVGDASEWVAADHDALLGA
ncbi:IS4 family transposase [uncultured Thiodictyon sp.]|uniref:IS4 family transposase n=1 Tax=uncultured Thiodictyon sp. TaxID=1846217 RepID=UPI0025FBCF42|nr:IS4 family transposase [uncultured Thiodictyon sp.]